MKKIFNPKAGPNKFKRNLKTEITKLVQLRGINPNIKWVNQPTPWGIHYYLSEEGNLVEVLPDVYRAVHGKEVYTSDTLVLMVEQTAREADIIKAKDFLANHYPLPKRVKAKKKPNK